MQTGIKAIDAHDPGRPRPARADHRRPPDRQDRHRHRRHHQPEGRRHDLRLCGDRAKALDRRAGCQNAHRLRRHGLHDRGGRFGVRSRADAIPGALLGLRHRRILPRQQPPRAVHLRRSFQARRRLPRNLAAAAAAAGPRSLSRRRVLSAQPPARARRQAERRQRRRVADRAAVHRNAGRRRFGLHSRPTSSRSPTARSSSKPTCSTPTFDRR